MQSLLIPVTGESVVCNSQLLHREFWGTTGVRTAYSHMLLVSGHIWGPGPRSVTHWPSLYQAQEKRALC